MKKISTLNMKSDRSVKCEKQLYAKCEVLVSSMTSQTVNLVNLVDLVSFFRHFWDIGGGGQHFKGYKSWAVPLSSEKMYNFNPGATREGVLGGRNFKNMVNKTICREKLKKNYVDNGNC